MIAVITGGGTGIGRAVALALREDGWSLVLAGRREEPLRATAEALEQAGGSALVVPTDVSDASQVNHLFEAAVDRFGRVDLLFNNAGVGGPPRSLDEISPEDMRRVVDTNLMGSLLCTAAAMRVMRRQDPQGGRIINNGSISATTPRPHSALYTATKHAISGLTKSTALDGRAFNIACGQVDVGNAKTDMTSRMEQGMPQPDGSVRPEPTMPVDDVGRAVRYMASLPLGSNVLTMTVMATAMPFVGRG
ncbi:MAG: SDR family oxidoreductase [Candidatus Dormibacteraeota bacterium]|nr:SDR family oxidoreductase [Candidatus Dormibacteraeota bacterium]